MGEAATQLHRKADAIVYELEELDPSELERDDAFGDECRAARDNARKWRARIEEGI
jgi:hypothetical protein